MPELLRSIHSYFAGERDFRDVELDARRVRRRSSAALADALRHVPCGEVVTLRRARRARRAPGAARAAGTFCARTASRSSSRATASSPPAGSAATARSAWSTSDGCSARGSMACRSLTTCATELAAIAPRRDCDRLAELSGLFHTAGSVHLRGRGEVSLHLDLASSAVARRAFALLRSFGVESEIRTYRRRAFDRATRYQLHVPGDERRSRRSPRRASSTPRLAPLERPPQRVVARACCRGAYLRGALLGAGSLTGPRAPHLEIRTPRSRAPVPARRRGRGGARSPSPTAAGTPSRTRRARTRSRPCSRAPAPATPCSRFEERAVLGETRARANRLANADHANLVRTSRAAHVQLGAVRALRRAARSRRCPSRCARSRELRLRHPSLPLASSPHAASRRRRRPPCTGGSGSSRGAR